MLAKPSVKSLADLAGRRVAVETTAVGAILRNGALEKGGLKVADIEIVACPVNKHVECYELADALITFEPAKTKLQKRGARLLFGSSQLPGQIVDVLVVRSQVLEAQPQVLARLLRGYFAARQLLDEQPRQASGRMAERTGLSGEEMLASFGGRHGRHPARPDQAGERGGLQQPLHCVITDRGGNLAEERLARIFEGFAPSSEATGCVGGGGLDLPACSEIIHLHRGQVWAQSSPDGGDQGLAIHFTLPAEVS